MVELWDVLDENGQGTGRVHERGTTMDKGDYHLEVHVLIMNDEGEFLISKRSPNKSNPNLWECTGGNAVAGDDSLTTALKEVKEELGIDLERENGRRVQRQAPCGEPGCNGLVDVWLFKQNVDIATVVLQPEETCDAMWASTDDIGRMIDEGTFTSWGWYKRIEELYVVVRMQGIEKQYPKVKALDSADFVLERGTIHAILGENGAGKSTLMKVLYGMVKADAGQVWINERAAAIRNPLHATAMGIGMVHQHFMLADALSVLDNIIAGVEPGRRGIIDYKTAQENVRQLITQSNLALDDTVKVETLSVGEKQRVEILKVLYRGADIMILDEPTAVLTPLEVEGLFGILRKLKDEGKSIIIITHKLYEAIHIADDITVMRDGKVTGKADPKTTTPLELATMMVGRHIRIGERHDAQKMGDVRFNVRDLWLKEKKRVILENISLEIRAGEILGIAGVEGNGQTELINVLTGLTEATQMEITLDGEPLTGGAFGFLSAGMGHIPEDRQASGLIESMSIGENTMLGYHNQNRFKSRGLYDSKKIMEYAQEGIDMYGVKAPNAQTLVSELSGGNQQKLVVARVLRQSPKVLVCAHPTRGVDVGAIEYIHDKIREYRDAGNSVLLISADLHEVMSLSDTIAVLYQGKIVNTAPAAAHTDVELGLMMTGGAV
ncbi:MAG: ATP-binding cassette domain-containing protein [Defluviitaleaceae bacterium]|nr:ATP-binding cassette domain-containing protein [Defluviitaleaceae bacterium]